MYAKLNDLYLSAQTNIFPNVWYKIANKVPHLSSNISHITSLIMGCQPKGLQHNYAMLICPLCDLNERESSSHVLFRCENPLLKNERLVRWQSVLSAMPSEMIQHISCLNEEDKSRFILTCLGGGYVSEWIQIYSNIAMFVTNMYVIRDVIYKSTQV